MTRRRKFQQTDEGMWVPYTESDMLVVPAYRNQVQIDPAARKSSINFFARMHHRTANAYNDPLSVALVFDGVQRWSPAYYIRSKYMVQMLNAKQSAIRFDTTNVGRILSELAEVAAEAYEDRPDLLPIMSVRDYKTHIWFVNSQPTTYAWFWNIRIQLEEMCVSLMNREAEGIDPKKYVSVFAEIDTTAVTQ